MINLIRFCQKKILKALSNKIEEPVADILIYQLGRMQGK